jgi:excisionase family DNA binding protein
MAAPQLPKLMSPAELAEYLDVPVRTIYIWRDKGTGPRGLKVGKHIRYRITDVETWLEQQASA